MPGPPAPHPRFNTGPITRQNSILIRGHLRDGWPKGVPVSICSVIWSHGAPSLRDGPRGHQPPPDYPAHPQHIGHRFLINPNHLPILSGQASRRARATRIDGHGASGYSGAFWLCGRTRRTGCKWLLAGDGRPCQQTAADFRRPRRWHGCLAGLRRTYPSNPSANWHCRLARRKARGVQQQLDVGRWLVHG